jgi:hypothetical protein
MANRGRADDLTVLLLAARPNESGLGINNHVAERVACPTRSRADVIAISSCAMNGEDRQAALSKIPTG